MTEKEKMLAGMVYDATTPELIADLQATREALHEFNMLRPSETQRMKEIRPIVHDQFVREVGLFDERVDTFVVGYLE